MFYMMKKLILTVTVSLFIIHLHIDRAHTARLKKLDHRRRSWRKSTQRDKNSLFAEQRLTFDENFRLTNTTVPTITDTPKCAQGLTFCEDFDLYPYEHIKKMLRKTKMNKFVSSSKPLPLVPRIRFEGEPSTCPARKVLKYPRVGKTKNNTWEFIINQEDYVQAVYIKICTGNDNSCQEAASFGYIAQCKQRYAFQKLKTPQNNNIVTKVFTMPKDCVCTIRRDPSPFARFG